jgi:hypothetical protein
MSKKLQAAAERILEARSQSRMECEGGYPDQWAFRKVDGKDHVICATVDHDGAPVLDIYLVDDFIQENDCWLDEP